MTATITIKQGKLWHRQHQILIKNNKTVKILRRDPKCRHSPRDEEIFLHFSRGRKETLGHSLCVSFFVWSSKIYPLPPISFPTLYPRPLPLPSGAFLPCFFSVLFFKSVLLIKSISYDKPHHSSDPSSPLHFIHSHFPTNHLLTSPDMACQPSSPPVTSTAEQQSSRTKHGPAPPRPVLRLAALATTAVPVQKTNP